MSADTVLPTDERQELARSVRAACEKFASEERVRAAAYDGDDSCGGVDTELWTVLCAQVGVAAIAVPEHLGGAGYGASALGVALALGEIDGEIADDAVLTDWSLASRVASSSAGIELNHNVVIVLGNSRAAAGDYVIGHDVMRDAIDARAILSALRGAGLGTAADPLDFDPGRIANVLAKADPSPDGLVRGFRHTMLDDTDISATRHARAAVGGIIAGLAGCPAIFVSGGAEHQGPDGGGPVAIIATQATSPREART